MTDTDMGTWTYTYDNIGNLKSQTDARGCVTAFNNDRLSRLLSKTYGGACSSADSLIYTYDTGLLRYDAFDGSALPAGWSQAGSVTVSGGQVHLTGAGNWNTSAQRTGTVGDGQSARFAFRLNAVDALAALFLHSGTWGQADYRRWGLYISGGAIYRQTYEGTTSYSTVQLLTLQANVWYEGVLKVDGVNTFVAELWERDNPSVRAVRVESRPAWSGRSWTFMNQVHTGLEDLDYYAELQAQAWSLGRRTGMGDSSGSAAWAYDARGRVTQETKTISGQSFSTSYTYDSLDRVVTTTYPDGEVVRNTYNAAGQPATLRSDTYSYNYVSSASYNALGQPTEMSLGNNTLTRWGYRGLGGNWDTPPTAGLTGYGRLYRIRTTAPSGEPWLDLRYGYDAVGNVTRMLDVPREASGWLTATTTFPNDTFDIKNTTNWTWSTHQTVPHPDGGNNVVKNTGTGSNYDANFYRNAFSLVNGKGLQLRFKVSQTAAIAVFAIEANDSTYRRFGVIANAGKLYVQYNDNGSTYRLPADILTNLQADTWYVLRIVVDDSGRGFYLEAYQENTPTVRGSYNITMSAGKAWRFHHWIYGGTAYLDDYREFDTSGLSWTPDERMGFTYDALDRLVGASPVNGGQGYNQTYSYNQIGNLMTRDAFVYTYNAPTPGSGCSAGTPITKPHAVQTVSSLGSFTYDCNGNMLTRVENGVSYAQGWNQENRLQTVTVNGATTTFTYDGDGVLVKKTVGITTTYYVGPHYEKIVSPNVVTATKYYYFGSQRVAMRVCTGANGSCGTNGATSTLTYLHADHLGSASLSTNATGGKVNEMRYYPYGETRSGAIATDRRYTGQRQEIGLGLYDYNARYYDPLLGRFLSADSIVPSPANPQSLNRYAYVLNNPLRYTDPTGHYSEEEIMKSFGVSTWNEVLAFFQNENSSLYGRWGWLEILRRATDGTFLDQGVTYSLSGGIADWQGRGIFESSSSGIFLRCLKNLSGSELMQLNPLQRERFVDQKIVGAGQGEFAGRGEAKDIYRLSGVGQSFYTHISTQYSHVRFDASKVDWVDVTLDTIGLTSDLITLGVGGRGINALQVAVKSTDTIGFHRTYDSSFADGSLTFKEKLDLAVDILGVGLPYLDAISLISNLANGVSITP